MDRVKVFLKKLDDRAVIPEYSTAGSAAVDLRVLLEKGKTSVVIPPQNSITLGTGIAISVPDTVATFLIPRSGLGSKGIVLGNLTGLIDSDYRGEIKLNLWNRNPAQYVTIDDGMRAAQLFCLPVLKMEFEEVDELTETDRSSGGFGSTGHQ